MKKLFAIATMAAVVLASEPVKTDTELHPEIYPATLVVTQINEETDTVTASTATGFVYEFYGVEDWMVGDLCSAIMNDNGTPEITDDRIEKCQYSGYTELYDWVLLEAVEHWCE